MIEFYESQPIRDWSKVQCDVCGETSTGWSVDVGIWPDGTPMSDAKGQARCDRHRVSDNASEWIHVAITNPEDTENPNPFPWDHTNPTFRYPPDNRKGRKMPDVILNHFDYRGELKVNVAISRQMRLRLMIGMLLIKLAARIMHLGFVQADVMDAPKQ